LTTQLSPGRTIEASVLVAGARLNLHRRSDGRPFIAGIPGAAYTIGVRNLTGSRIEVIASVDGRHVLRDETADPGACQGLVIPAGRFYEFAGWRLDDEAAREFIFADPAASVAAMATGSTSNVGVIGLAVHRERQAMPASYEAMDSYGPGPVMKGISPVAVASAGGLGTGIGERRDDHVGRTSFTRDGNPPDILVIGYDTEESLRAQGIIRPADPQAFPGQPTRYERYASS
jgi:hypothetical protein